MTTTSTLPGEYGTSKPYSTVTYWWVKHRNWTVVAMFDAGSARGGSIELLIDGISTVKYPHPNPHAGLAVLHRSLCHIAGDITTKEEA